MYNMKISNDVSRHTKFEVIIMPVVRLPLFVAVAAVRVIGAVAGHRSSDVLEREKGYLPALFRSWREFRIGFQEQNQLSESYV